MEKRKKKTGYQKTLEFLKKYEGFKDTTYLDGNGIPTIGYGFTDPELVAKGYISRADADKRLELEVMSREKELRSKIKNWVNLSDDSKTALLSYYFNYPAGFKDTTRFMLNWNAGNYAAAIKEVDAGMNDPNNPGLRPRRLAEQELLNSDPYLTGIKTTTTGDGNKKMIFPRSWKEPELMETWIPKITNPQYPLNPADRAPESIDSWNGAQSPSKGPMMPSLQKLMDERKRMYDFFGENAVATGKKKMIPSMSSMLSRNMENYISGILGIPDVYEDAGYTYTPMMYSPMPTFEDGKQPKYADPSWNEQWLSKRLTLLQENIDTSNKMYPRDKLQVYNDAVKEYNDVKNYIDNSNDPELQKNRAQYLNEVARDYYEHLDFNHWEDNAEDELKRQMDNIRRTREYSSMLPGKNRAYYKNDPSGPFIKYRMLFKTDPLIRLHERTHSSLAYPQYNKILEINKRHGYVPKEGIDYHFYSPTEIYSLMMEIRKELGLDPSYILNLDDVKRIRESSNGGWFRDKSDLHILDYFNEVASNTNPLFDPNNMIKAFGNTDSKIIYAKDGKLPKFEGGKGNQILEAYDKFVEDDPYYIATAMSYLPFIGTAMDIREAAKNPTAENIGYAGLSGLTDLVGGRIFAKVAGNILKAKKMAKAVKKAELDHWRNTPFYLSMPKQLAEHTVKYYAKRAADEVLDAANVTEEFMPEARLLPAASVYFPDFVANVNLQRDKQLPGHKDGKSPIRIKPENRGKLTRLKKRTGKSESELYNDGNPAHKKMVVFARNARKWKH